MYTCKREIAHLSQFFPHGIYVVSTCTYLFVFHASDTNYTQVNGIRCANSNTNALGGCLFGNKHR